MESSALYTNGRFGGYIIETGVPLPKRAHDHLQPRPKSELRQAVEALGVGQSLLARDEDVRNLNLTGVAKGLKRKFATRADGDKMRRVWRVK